MQAYFTDFAGFLRSHLSLISIGAISVLLVLYGSHLNKFLRKITRKLPILLRYLVFLAVCTLGYAMLANVAIQWLLRTLRNLPNTSLILIVLLIFMGLAWLARAGKEI